MLEILLLLIGSIQKLKDFDDYEDDDEYDDEDDDDDYDDNDDDEDNDNFELDNLWFRVCLF